MYYFIDNIILYLNEIVRGLLLLFFFIYKFLHGITICNQLENKFIDPLKFKKYPGLKCIKVYKIYLLYITWKYRLTERMPSFQLKR